MYRQVELSTPGLTVRFLVRMEDVTEKIVGGINDETPEVEREKLIDARTAAVTKAAMEGTHYIANAKPLFYGNQYFLYVYEEFTDVRLV